MTKEMTVLPASVKKIIDIQSRKSGLKVMNFEDGSEEEFDPTGFYKESAVVGSYFIEFDVLEFHVRRIATQEALDTGFHLVDGKYYGKSAITLMARLKKERSLAAH